MSTCDVFLVPQPYICDHCGHDFEFSPDNPHTAPITLSGHPVCPECWNKFLYTIGVGVYVGVGSQTTFTMQTEVEDSSGYTACEDQTITFDTPPTTQEIVEVQIKPRTRQGYIDRLKALQQDEDTESAHFRADDLLCMLLIQLGYGDVVAEYVDIEKWYA